MKLKKFKRIPRVYIYIVIFCISLFLITISVSLGRYVYNKILDLYFMTQSFYFESDKLKRDNARYSLDYWNGVDPYDIVVNLNSFKNDKLKSSSDIEYEISYECPSNLICSTSKDDGVITSASNTDSFVFTMTPNAIFNDGDSTTVKIIARSLKPYVKELSASFTFVVGKYGLGHEISDSSGSDYLNLKVTNTLDSYFVKEAFGSYSSHDSISVDTYLSLSDEDKSKCASAVITVSFDPDIIKIDNTATDYLKAYNIETKVIDGFNYVKKFTFDMDSSISDVIKFYKNDKSIDYSNSSVINVTYDY